MNIHQMIGEANEFEMVEENGTDVLYFTLLVVNHRRGRGGQKVKTSSELECVVYDTAAQKIYDDYDIDKHLLMVSCEARSRDGLVVFRVNEFRIVGKA
jgi:hypothetical protein